MRRTKPLIETNPYLKDADMRAELIARSVRTSSGVEGIKPKNENVFQFEILHRRDKKIYKETKE